jgi:hypothetical protein
MAISATDPFKGRQYPGKVILSAVRWYLRYPLAYKHVSELLAERGLLIDASCIWRWVQARAGGGQVLPPVFESQPIRAIASMKPI